MADQDRVAALRQRVEQNDGDQFIQAQVAAGRPLLPLLRAAKGTRWRFVVTGSGSDVSVATKDDLLSEWLAALGRLNEVATGLRKCDADLGCASGDFYQIRVRTIVGMAIRETEIIGMRIDRHLLEGELVPGIEEGISECLKPHGFQWDGGREISEIDGEGFYDGALEDEIDYEAVEEGVNVDRGKLCDFNISELRVLAGSDDRDAFLEAASRMLREGLTPEALLEIVSGTNWRYVIERSGTASSFKLLSELVESYDELLEQVTTATARLSCLRQAEGGPKGMFRHIEEREALAAHCQEANIEGLRMLRYLASTDRKIDPGYDIERVLGAKNLRFNGYEVEAWAGDNAAIVRRGISYMAL